MNETSPTNKPSKSKNIAGIFCLLLLGVLCLTVLLRVFTREVLFHQFGQMNSFIQTVWFDQSDLNKGNKDIDWEERYPFSQHIASQDLKTQPGKSLLDQATDFVLSVYQVISEIKAYTSERLVGREYIAKVYGFYENLIGWDSMGHFQPNVNSIIKLEDGQLMTPVGKLNPTQAADALAGLKTFCDQNETDFLFVHIPYKVCAYQDPEINGVTDFSNDSMDRMAEALRERGIPFLDLRDDLHTDWDNHHELFFKTDHHWKPETGFWAAGKILAKLHDDYDYPVDSSILTEENFRKDIYSKYYLGEYGRNVTLMQTDPEDITIYYPEFPTQLRCEIPDKGLDKTGDFSILYSTKMLESADYYKLHAYSAYLYGNNPLTHLTNYLAENDLRVLIIRDSYAGVVVPFLSLSINRIDTLDLRYFNGSVRNYIETTRPDMVIVMYSPMFLEETKQTDAHTTMYDFR